MSVVFPGDFLYHGVDIVGGNARFDQCFGSVQNIDSKPTRLFDADNILGCLKTNVMLSLILGFERLEVI